MQRNLAAIIVALAVLGASGSAWAFGVGVGYKFPTGDFGDLYDGGFGASATMGFPLAPMVSAYGEVGYSHFAGKEIIAGISADGIDVWNFTGGAKVSLGSLYVGGELGYYTEIDEFALSPLVGMGLGPIDLSGRYKLTGDVHWFDLRASISFGP